LRVTCALADAPRKSVVYRGRRGASLEQRIDLFCFCEEVACTSTLTTALVNPSNLHAFGGGFVHQSGAKQDVLQFLVNLDVLRRVVEDLFQHRDRVLNLSVSCEDFGFGDLPDYEGVVKRGGLVVQRSGRAYDVGRAGLYDVAHAEIVEPLKMHRLIRLESSQLLERGNCFGLVTLLHRSLNQRIKRGDEIVVFSNPIEDLRKTLQCADVIHVAIENASEKVDGFVLFALCDEDFHAPVDLLRRTIQIAQLKKPPSDLEQIVISILVQLDQTQEGSFGVIHQPGRQIGAAENRKQLDIAGISFECFA